jgi:hypothetical protein
VPSHLARIGAVSRPTGGAACDDARRYCAEVLTGLGFVVKERSFKYSQFVGKWAAPVVALAVALAATQWYLTAPGWPFPGVALLVLVLLMVGRGVLRGPLLRAEGVNLAGVRGAAPRVWLVAHIDSKWQPVSMLQRVAGVGVLAVSAAIALATAPAHSAVSSAALVFVWLGALPLLLSVVGARNHGTLDNASGVAAVLDAAALIPPGCSIGVMITDAEELALAGAAAWARDDSPAIALNCDSIDDDGALLAMYSGKAPDRLISRLREAASAHGEPLRVMRLIPGILTDHVPLARAGWETLTLSRGTVRTLQRIHTSRDTLEHMSGRGIPGAARVLARVATELAECK